MSLRCPHSEERRAVAGSPTPPFTPLVWLLAFRIVEAGRKLRIVL